MNWKKKIFNMRSSLAVTLIGFVFLICCTESINKDTDEVLPFYDDPWFTPKWISPSDAAALGTFHQISPFTLTNQDGETITEKSIEHKIYVVDFFFTSCPGICPKMTKNMGLIQDEFIDDDEVLMISHSVTPKRDSVPALKKYAQEKNVISGKWHLVTGTQQEIYKLGRKDYFVEEDLGIEKDEDEFLHTENFVLIDQSRHIRGIYNGLSKTSINQLIDDIKKLKTSNELK